MSSLNYVSKHEEFFHETNPSWIYADAPGYDFESINGVRIEVMSTSHHNRSGLPRLRFQVKRGHLVKSQRSHFLVAAIRESIYYGTTDEITEYVITNLNPSVLERSFRKGKKTYTRISPGRLYEANLMQRIPIIDANTLTERLTWTC